MTRTGIRLRREYPRPTPGEQAPVRESPHGGSQETGIEPRPRLASLRELKKNISRAEHPRLALRGRYSFDGFSNRKDNKKEQGALCELPQKVRTAQKQP